MRNKLRNFVGKFPVLEQNLKAIKNWTENKNTKPKMSIVGEANNIDVNKNTVLIDCEFDIDGHNNTIIIESGCVLQSVTFYIRGNNNTIIIGEKVKYNGVLWETCNNGRIEIGEGTTTEVNVNMQISEDSLEIVVGRDCMFSSNIFIWPQDWHPIFDENNQHINPGKSIYIKDHVWVGFDAKILKSVTIGSNNIIGTNAIVTKSILEENVVIAGNPGKIVKRRVHWKR